MKSQLLKRCSISVIGFLAPTFMMAQSLPGLWLVQEVSMGDQKVTPQERWFKYDDAGNFSSGNGWLKHSDGTYVYNPSDSSFEAHQVDEPIDEFGAFKLWFEGEKMIWQRIEADMQVTVKLERIEEVPPSLADKVQGLWQLDSIAFTDPEVTNSATDQPTEQLFLRWDREYRISNSEENMDRGYWHIHGHRPELTLISRSSEQTFTVYEIIQNGEFLILKLRDGADAGTRWYYQRV